MRRQSERSRRGNRQKRRHGGAQICAGGRRGGAVAHLGELDAVDAGAAQPVEDEAVRVGVVARRGGDGRREGQHERHRVVLLPGERGRDVVPLLDVAPRAAHVEVLDRPRHRVPLRRVVRRDELDGRRERGVVRERDVERRVADLRARLEADRVDPLRARVVVEELPRALGPRPLAARVGDAGDIERLAVRVEEADAAEADGARLGRRDLREGDAQVGRRRRRREERQHFAAEERCRAESPQSQGAVALS